ncbi:hypothetical protein XBKB1_700047 [Xenorhabdus bovienii str. kraussei Becker Underwood]|uniref:Uncharacterized protein n=1 Tax=Xenorhabdus bovienii str. kraussei Becker Underwood TaxID=1398204 RepID=A0A077Q0D7_XENBV|nr:hypothetical protein XBKB1_700047 [Xenorhabdus bovienii str. kraussei Becker Underwood]
MTFLECLNMFKEKHGYFHQL